MIAAMKWLTIILSLSLAACDGAQMRHNARPDDSKTFDQDYHVIAVATFKLIDKKGEITTIVIPPGFDALRKNALKGIAKIVVSDDDPHRQGYTLPAGYFAMRTFTIEDGIATIIGQLGPVTATITSVGLPDCGKIYTAQFFLENGDWASHSYKVETCAQLREWWPVDAAAPGK